MTLQKAIICLAANPSLVMIAEPAMVIGFNVKGTLINFGRGPNAPAVLKLRDFMREDWEIMTADQVAQAATLKPEGE